MRRFSFPMGLLVCAVSSACTEESQPGPAGGGSGGNGGDGGGGATLEGLFGSGERLVAVALDGGDGAEAFLHFHDVELDEECDFADAGDGALRCLPVRHVGYVSYADAACTDPVVVTSCGAALPQHVVSEPSAVCFNAHAQRREVWEVGAEHPGTELYDDFGEGCTPRVFDPVDNRAFAVTAADPALFAEAEVQSETLDGGLGRRIAVTSDGAHRVLGGFDAETDEACDVQEVDDGEPRCLSSNMAYGVDHSSSPTCDVQDVAYAVSDVCGEPRAIIQYVPNADECLPSDFSLFEPGAALDLTEVYRGTPGACSMVGDSGSFYFALGDPLPADSFRTLAWSELGAGRLRLRALTTPGGTLLATRQSEWHDSELGSDCSIWDTTSGKRCVPFAEVQAVDGTGVFADDACTELLVQKSALGCAADPFPYIATHTAPGDSCSAPVFEHVYEIGAEHTGSVYALGSSCLEVSPPGDVVLYTRGAEVPLEDFAPIEEP